MAAEQHDVYIKDFYDAAYVKTQPAELGDGWKKATLLFWRGCPRAPQPPFPAVGTSDWHNGSGTPHTRDETGFGFARGLEEQVVPDGSGEAPLYEVEVERLAAACHVAAEASMRRLLPMK